MILHLNCVPLSYDNENHRPVMASTHEEYLAVLKQHRNVILSQSDWRILPDSPLSEEEKQEWISYRNYLRDLTKSLPKKLTEQFEINDPPVSGGPVRVMTPENGPR